MKNVSKIIQFPITLNQYIDITITKKHMKNIRLSISKAGKIKVSIPYTTTYSYAYQFLVRKRDWIYTQLNKISQNLAKDNCNFVNNGNIFILGNNYPLKVESSSKNQVIFDTIDNEYTGFTIYSKDLSIEYISNLFIKWCKKYFLNLFTNRLNYIYSQMFTTYTPPPIKIKAMKSMWGNCNYVKRIITLSLYLGKAPISCIDYVIVHELAHLIYHNHSKDFHNLLTKLMPDWKTRKKQLNNYSLKF